jgi:hypothetical protein
MSNSVVRSACAAILASYCSIGHFELVGRIIRIREIQFRVARLAVEVFHILTLVPSGY